MLQNTLIWAFRKPKLETRATPQNYSAATFDHAEVEEARFLLALNILPCSCKLLIDFSGMLCWSFVFTKVFVSFGFLFLMDDHFCCGNCYSFCSSASAMRHCLITVYSIIQLFLHELIPICSMFSKPKAYDSSLLFHVYCFLHHSFFVHQIHI